MPNGDASQPQKILGFTKPESVVHDTTQDIYFVSNVGAGSPSASDQNGFISRVSPDGTLTTLKAIAGLNGRKGSASSRTGSTSRTLTPCVSSNRFTGASRRDDSGPGPEVVSETLVPQ